MRVTGTVVRFDEVRGYGFVTPDTGGEDVFVHVNDLEIDKRLMETGAIVEFEVESGDRGLKASRVSILNSPPGDTRGTPVRHAPSRSGEEDLCDVLSAKEFSDEVTETLLTAAPAMTAEQILRVRHRLVELARGHGWIDDDHHR